MNCSCMWSKGKQFIEKSCQSIQYSICIFVYKCCKKLFGAWMIKVEMKLGIDHEPILQQ